MYCEIKYIKYDVINILFKSFKTLFLSTIIAIELIILVNYFFNDIRLIIFGVLSWLIYLIPTYIKAYKYCKK